jgi:hypothetical protein
VFPVRYELNVYEYTLVRRNIVFKRLKAISLTVCSLETIISVSLRKCGHTVFPHNTSG